MSTATILRLIQGPITCHCWNGDRTKFAICPHNTEVHIYSKQGVKWEVESVLRGEDTAYVTGMDWAPKSGLLVTCTADGNAYLWRFTDGAWKKALVILQMNRAAIVVKWSPQVNKLAVGNVGGIAYICYYEEHNDRWVSKHIKKPISSMITSLYWHPNNCLLAVGFSNFKVRVFSAYVNDIEPQPEETGWAKKMVFGRIIAFSNSKGGWVHSVSFSTSGNKLCWVGDSSISVANLMRSGQVTVVKHSFLPYVTCQFITENFIVAAGHDCTPMVWDHNGNVLTYIDKLDQKKEKIGFMNATAKCCSPVVWDHDDHVLTYINKLNQKKEEIGFINAMTKFQRLNDWTTACEGTQDSIHPSPITQISVYSSSGREVFKFCTSGMDGRLVIWDCRYLVTLCLTCALERST